MRDIKAILVKTLKQFNLAFAQSTDHSKQLTLLMTLYLMGENTIYSSPLSAKQKNRLYHLLSELRQEATLEDIYLFYERTLAGLINSILKPLKSLSYIYREYCLPLVISIDDTPLEVYGDKMSGAKKLHDGKRYFNGYHVVFIGLSIGKDFRIPLSFRIYQPDSSQTRIQLAVEMLEDVLAVLPQSPRMISFDNLYLTEGMVKIIKHYKLHWVSKLRKNRRIYLSGDDYESVTGQQLLFKKYWYKLPFQVKFCIEKMKGLNRTVLSIYDQKIARARLTYNDEDNAIVTSDRQLRQKRITFFYRLRWKIEEIFRIMKNHLSLVKVYYRTLESQALIHGIKLMATICLLWLRYQVRSLRNMSYKQLQQKIKLTFQNSSKYCQSPYAELMKYKLV